MTGASVGGASIGTICTIDKGAMSCFAPLPSRLLDADPAFVRMGISAVVRTIVCCRSVCIAA